ncbi:hypothetical protein D3C75_1345480 [compost metagenome]
MEQTVHGGRGHLGGKNDAIVKRQSKTGRHCPVRAGTQSRLIPEPPDGPGVDEGSWQRVHSPV